MEFSRFPCGVSSEGRKRRRKEWGREKGEECHSVEMILWKPLSLSLSLSLSFSLTLVPCFRANRLTEDVPLRGVAFPFCLQEMGERFGRLLFKEETCIYFVLLFRCFYCYSVFIILVIVIQFLMNIYFTLRDVLYSFSIHAHLSKNFSSKPETIFQIQATLKQ